MGRIKSLCEQYTDLNINDVAMIEGIAAVLPLIANLEGADVFIDCPTTDGEAIVVAEAKPERICSSYKNTVVGLLAKPEDEPAVARTISLGSATKRMKAVTQENTYVIQSVEPIFSGSRVIGTLIIEQHAAEPSFKADAPDRDIEQSSGFEREAGAPHAMHPALSENNEWLLECIDEALLLVDYNGVVALRNSLAQDLYRKLGFVDDILGKKYEDVRLIVGDFGDDGSSFSIETKVGTYSLLVKKTQIGCNGIAFAVLIRNVTFLREQEKQLVLKTVAIKEIHHRVKNSLQTIASLLRLQARRAKDRDTKQYLEESMNRILTIAVTHDLLAQSGVDQVMIGKVIANIKGSAIRYFSRPYFSVAIDIEGGDFEVSSDTAASVALVLNELLQNSLKYAFPGRDKGHISIKIDRGGLYSAISVTDDGCGYDTGAVEGDSLGLKIVRTIVKDKLQGKLTVESSAGGTCTKFDFKN